MDTYREKVRKSILEGIMKVKAKSKSEQLSKLEHMINFNNIMKDYDNILKILQRESLNKFKMPKETYEPSQFDVKIFESVIIAVQSTETAKDNWDERLEQVEYMTKLKNIILDYPNIIKTLEKNRNRQDWGDIDF